MAVTGALFLLLATLSAQAAELRPHTATYTSNLFGLSVAVKQTLLSDRQQRWTLTNRSNIPLADIEESSTFVLGDSAVIPLRYDHTNDLNRSRNCHLLFDWTGDRVTDDRHTDLPIPADDSLWDPLSFQVQLRLDLMNSDKHFDQKTYPQILRGKIRHYQVDNLGDDQLNTELGTFATVKVKQYRPDRGDYTLIWLAREWDYMILRLQHIEAGKISYQIDLQRAVMNGRQLLGH